MQFCFARLTREITDWFFNTQNFKNTIPMQNADVEGDDESTPDEIITLAVPKLFEKMFEIINQIFTSTKDENVASNYIIDGIKKPLASILYLYESNGIGRDNVRWKATPPIDTLIGYAKNVLWSHILKVSNNARSMVEADIPGIVFDDELTPVLILASWPKHESRLIFSLIICKAKFYS